MAKAERLVNLIALLLATSRPLPLDQVAELVPGYDAEGESLRRMFERDKDELRRMGVPIERAAVDAWGTDEGYFIDPDAYGMPHLELAPDERAALALAASVWSGGLGGGRSVLTKLDLDPRSASRPLQADLEGASPVLGAVLDALQERRRVTFTYRAPGREPAKRKLAPYALVHRLGTWYVVGHDTERDALRSFRLSRIESDVRPARAGARGPEFEVPGDFNPAEVFPTAGEPAGQDLPQAVVRVAEPAARLAELRGAVVLDESPADGVGPVRVSVPVRDEDAFLAWALVNEAEVLAPGELRAAYDERLAGLAALLERDPGPVPSLGEVVSGEDEEEDAAPGRRAPASAAGRVQRLLAMVPWALTHPGASVDEVCERFGIDRSTLVADLDLLFVSGLPPYGPGDLIEAWVEGDRIHIGLADYFSRAPRLTWREAVGLYLAGRALARLPGFDDNGALDRALKALEAGLPGEQVGRIQELAGRVSVDLEGDAVERAHLATLTQAADARRRVVLEYYTGSRSELTTRKVDPWVIFPASGHWYLTGWCHRAVGERLFRLDRIVTVSRTDEPFELPAGFDPSEHRGVPMQFEDESSTDCVLALAPHAQWLASRLPLLGSDRLPDGRLAVRFAARELGWAVRLVVRLAPHADPLAPPQLRSAVAGAVERLRHPTG
jgi:predicted DNA-binding transcriptional regulator YafY